MSIRLEKEWVELSEASTRLKGNLGVFQLADSAKNIIYIGYAGAKSVFGLKSEIDELSQTLTEAAFVRWEVTAGYWSRYKELMMLYQFDYQCWPKNNESINLGRLSPE